MHTSFLRSLSFESQLGDSTFPLCYSMERAFNFKLLVPPRTRLGQVSAVKPQDPGLFDDCSFTAPQQVGRFLSEIIVRCQIVLLYYLPYVLCFSFFFRVLIKILKKRLFQIPRWCCLQSPQEQVKIYRWFPCTVDKRHTLQSSRNYSDAYEMFFGIIFKNYF